MAATTTTTTTTEPCAAQRIASRRVAYRIIVSVDADQVQNDRAGFEITDDQNASLFCARIGACVLLELCDAIESLVHELPQVPRPDSGNGEQFPAPHRRIAPTSLPPIHHRTAPTSPGDPLLVILGIIPAPLRRIHRAGEPPPREQQPRRGAEAARVWARARGEKRAHLGGEQRRGAKEGGGGAGDEPVHRCPRRRLQGSSIAPPAPPVGRRPTWLRRRRRRRRRNLRWLGGSGFWWRYHLADFTEAAARSEERRKMGRGSGLRRWLDVAVLLVPRDATYIAAANLEIALAAGTEQ
uniref:Uncharacterized protein n=1 Tax=Oryza punctata TaxID=4537 RepID=A0A0E0JRN9_ORYPU